MDKAIICWIIFVVLFVYGWVTNIVKLMGIDITWSGEVIVRVAGIFMAPLGAIMGFI